MEPAVPNKARDSNLELLRILCMALIVGYHFVGGTESWITYPQFSTFNLVAYHSVGLWGQTAVLCFVLITGYFMVDGRVKASKIIRLAAETWFYSVAITAIMVWAGLAELNPDITLRTFFPLMFRSYWFITDYILLLLIAPILNKLIHTLSKRELGYSIGVMLFVIYVWGGMTEFGVAQTIPFFVVFYMLAGYIRLYPNSITESKKVSSAVLLSCIVFGILLMATMNGIYQGTAKPLKLFIEDPALLWFIIGSTLVVAGIAASGIRRKKEVLLAALVVILFVSMFVYLPYRGLGIRGFLEDRYSVMIGLSAVALFLTFKNLDLGSNRVINWLAGGSLGVYLIHNQFLFCTYYWKKLFPEDMLMDPMFLPKVLLAILLIVLACILVDKLRGWLAGPIVRSGPICSILKRADDAFSRFMYSDR